MDRRIYGKGAYLGVYGTRRYPKGNGVPSSDVAAADPINRQLTTLQLKYAAANQAGGGANIDANRFEYIVPNNRRAQIHSAQCEVVRTVAGAGNTMQYALIYLERFQSAKIELIRATLHDDVVGARSSQLHTGIVDLFSGDKLQGWTSVVSGSCTLAIYINGIEFNDQIKVAGSGAFDIYDEITPNSGGAFAGIPLLTGPTTGSGRR